MCVRGEGEDTENCTEEPVSSSTEFLVITEDRMSQRIRSFLLENGNSRARMGEGF